MRQVVYGCETFATGRRRDVLDDGTFSAGAPERRTSGDNRQSQ